MRRLNVKLTVWLVGIILTSVVGVHLLHGYQLSRNADFLRLQAEKAEKDGNVKEAIKQYNQYLKYRDDKDGYSSLATLVVDAAKEVDSTRQDKIRAYNILEEAIRRHPDLSDVRRRLIDYSMAMRRFDEALGHIQYLVDDGTKDAALDLKAAQCYVQIGDETSAFKRLNSVVGFDDQVGQFKPEPEPGAKEIGAFELLADRLRKRGEIAKADEVMKQAVIYNPDSGKAHLARATYLFSTLGPQETADESKARQVEAKGELDRAIDLDRDDADVMLAAAAYAMAYKDIPGAHEWLDRALEKYPERQDVYLRLAQLAGAENDPQKALAILDRGSKHATETLAILQMLVEFQFQIGDTDAVRKSCKAMRETGFPLELIGFAEARIKFVENDFWGAVHDFEAIRPALARSTHTNYLQQLDILLGRCYESLGQTDRQRELYRQLVLTYPSLLGARLGETTALHALGMYEDATPGLALLTENAKAFPFMQSNLLQMLITVELQKPEDKRDWTQVEQIAELIYANEGRTELDNALLKGELLITQGRLDDAQKILTAARKENPKDVRVWTTLVKLLQRDPSKADRVGQLLNLAEKEVGDVFALRLERVRLIAQEGGDKAGPALEQMEKKLDTLTEPERVSMMMQLGAAYLQIKDYPSAKRCWKYAADKDRNNARIRQVLFELALDNKDEPGMREILEEMRSLPHFSSTSPLYKYCNAMSLLYPLNLRQQGKRSPLTEQEKNVLVDARKLIDEALAIRGEWSVLWRVRAEIDQLEGNLPGAITNYQRSLEFNRLGQALVARRLVQLLYTTKRFSEANDALKYVGQIGAGDPMHKMIEHIIFEKGDVEAALASAKKDVEADPKNATNLIFYGQLLDQALRTEEAEQILRQATEVGGEFPQTWTLLVRHLIANKKTAEAVAAIRQAVEPMSKFPLVLGSLYEQAGDIVQAEHYYTIALEEKPDDPVTVQKLVDFFIASQQVDKSIPYLDGIIAKNAEADASQVAWARRTRASIIAGQRDYEHVMEAVKLIEQNAKNGKNSPEDIQAMVNLLVNRTEPESRTRAVQLLEQLKQQRALLPAEQIALGQLYERMGKWREGKELMLSAISRQNNSPDMLIAFANLLVQHEEYDDASRWLERLDELLKTMQARTVQFQQRVAHELKARVLVKTGHPEEAVQLLQTLVPSPLPPNQLGMLAEVSRILEGLEQYDAAEKMLKEYVSLEPRGTIDMAAFLGRRGQVDLAFDMLTEARKNQSVAELLPCALEALRRHPEQATKERFKMLEDWALSGVQVEADAQQIKLLMAEMYDLQGRYSEVIQIYRDLLNNKESTAMQLAIVKNNLAFLLAVTKQQPGSGAEALKLISDAMKVMGPTPDLLDTRALAYLAQGNAKLAVADLRSAATDTPSVAKYFHLAQAEKQANNVEAAREALAQAQELGVDLNRFTPLEKKSYAELVDQLK